MLKFICNLHSDSFPRKNDLNATFESANCGRGLCIVVLPLTLLEVFNAVESCENGLFEVALRCELALRERPPNVESEISDFWHLQLHYASSSTIQKTITLVQEMFLKKCKLLGICETCEL